MKITINTVKTFKLEAPTGLTDVIITIYDESNNSVFNETMNEGISGVYVKSWTPTILGNYTASIQSLFIDRKTIVDIDVIESIPFEQIIDNQQVINNGIKKSSLGIPHNTDI